MGKYFKRFESHSQYEQYIQSENYITPNISVCDDEQEIHYNPLFTSHKYVDLGLPSGTLWATENIKDVNGNELYFAWGETQGYTVEQVGTDKNFSWDDYEFGTYDNLTKYNNTDGKVHLDTINDAATANWGTNWITPSKAHFEELMNNTTVSYTQINGINGMLLTSSNNGNTLFLPASGLIENGEVMDINAWGDYWSSSLYDNTINNGWRFAFYYTGALTPTYSDIRCDGFSIRPIIIESDEK